jgi:hypothetical protein
MKTNTLSLVLGTFFFGSTLFAQEFYQEKVSSESYSAKKIGYTLRNQQKVRDAFSSAGTVYKLDFTNTATKSVKPSIAESASAAVERAEYLDYGNKASIDALLSAKPEILSVTIPFRGRLLTADLVRADIFGDNFAVSSNDPASVASVTTGAYYQGMLRGENTIVSFSFFGDEFSALIVTGDPAVGTIEAGLIRTADNTGHTHILYSDDDLKIDLAHPCQAEALQQYKEAEEQLQGVDFPQDQEKATLKCVTYFWEAAYNMYQYFGSSQGVTNYLTTLFNNFQLVFNNESIGSQLNQIYVWTSADSYANSLDNFSAGRSNFNSNLAVLFSTTGGGGVAWLNTICQSGEYYRHAFCGSVGGSVPAFPNYSWPLNVSTHEVGHNLGSPHTHACTWTGGAIDGCGPAAGYNEGCTGPTPPAGGGTIMSYCHLTSTGISISNGFGPQPGNLIRSRVNSCITLTCETGGGGSSQCSAAFEPNESTAAAATIASGATNSAAISTSTDNDYYKIVTSGTNNIVYTLAGPSGVDYDMTIYNGSGTQIGSGATGSSSETVTLSNQAAGTYYIRIFGYNGANSATCYTIKATATATGGSCSTAFEPNESTAAAATISYGASNSAAVSSSTDKDYYKIVTSATANNTYQLTGPSGVDYDMKVYNSSGTEIGSGTSASATESVTINSQAAGTYYVYIYGYNGASSASCYTLRVAASGSSFISGGQAAEERISVYPNPASDKLFLGGSYSGKLMNQLGQVVLQFEKADQLSLVSLGAGVYLLQVDGVSEIQRVVKE